MKHWLIASFSAGALLLGSQAFAASTSPVKIGEQAKADSQVPTNGQSMDKVKNTFGIPVDEKPPIGEPPISRWIYAQFTVYFEGDKVIHTVWHKS